MSRVSPEQLLRDITREIDYLDELVSSGRIELYPLDPTMKRAVERAVEITGEAVRQLSRLDDATAANITDARNIVALRTILAHDYRKIDPDVILTVIRRHLPNMRREVLSLRAGELP